MCHDVSMLFNNFLFAQKHALLASIQKFLQEDKSSAPATEAAAMAFQNLPTEIHFRIAVYLPDHALHVLASLKCSAIIRDAYGNADPQRLRTQKANLSDFDRSVHQELTMRDTFERTVERTVERTCYTEELSNTLSEIIWSETVFHCLSCNRPVITDHFPESELLESVRKKVGMSKIVDRKCHAELRPVRLWNGRVITWSQLQEIWADMDPYIILPPIFSDHGYNKRKSAKLAAKSGRWSREPDTLRLRDLDHARLAWSRVSSDAPRELGVQATAEYYSDMCTVLRFQSIDADLIVTKVKQNNLYICPHLDLANVFTRPMTEDPIDFRPIGPGPYRPDDRVIDHLARQIDRREWSDHDPRRVWGMRDNVMPLLKQQTICCGHQNETCRTMVSIQRLRDDETTVWLKDLVRIKVVRSWRIDDGTADQSWQAQNGTSKCRQ